MAEEFSGVSATQLSLRPRRLGECLQVAELGFGTGLNLCCVPRHCLSSHQGRLHYIAFEAHPSCGGLVELGAQRPQPLFKELAKAAPPLLTGWHRRSTLLTVVSSERISR